MARIRSIKPEFWTSEQVAECSRDARLLFIGLWNFCDDEGRHPLALRAIKMQVFPGDDLKPEDIHRMLAELSANGLLEFYTVDNKQYLRVTGWKHQKIDHPQKPKYPPPPKDHSPNAHRTLAPDRIGEEGIGEEGIGKIHTPPLPPSQARGEYECNSVTGKLAERPRRLTAYERKKAEDLEKVRALDRKMAEDRAKADAARNARKAASSAEAKACRHQEAFALKTADPPPPVEPIEPLAAIAPGGSA